MKNLKIKIVGYLNLQTGKFYKTRKAYLNSLKKVSDKINEKINEITYLMNQLKEWFRNYVLKMKGSFKRVMEILYCKNQIKIFKNLLPKNQRNAIDWRI